MKFSKIENKNGARQIKAKVIKINIEAVAKFL